MMKQKLERKFLHNYRLTNLKREDGLNTLVEFMDKNLAKDDLLDSLKKLKSFQDFSHNEQQSVHKYIVTFDAKYRKIEKK